MKKLLIVAISLSSVIGTSPISAYAQQASTGECTCVTAPNKVSANGLGNIVSVNGNVLNAGLNGYEKASSGDHLIAGSHMSVANLATAEISVGKSCNLDVPANSEVNISQPAGPGTQICVEVSDKSPGSARASNPLPLVLIGAGIALGRGSNGASD